MGRQEGIFVKREPERGKAVVIAGPGADDYRSFTMNNRIHPLAAPLAAFGMLALLAGCGSDTETTTQRTITTEQPQTVTTTTTTVEED
ncbi:hypothetical protein Plav_3590 [Parvibaculum lavamentivorans DS-1]|uniref:Lipoprotein n=1 Tax=Parvibaculum lavamentivorans (strain DS-1 / DSM 13023 / NCIMB 13966) TaxID=402881 RepID=A7HZ55_PARL1|nr:hypothetical protein Plav_3590 [Parvibaculum lavamentivorans DS-1]